MTRSPTRLLALTLVALSLSSCELLGGFGGLDTVAPLVTVDENTAVLVDPPDAMAVASYYCREVLPAPSDLACALLGPRPRKEQLQFRFQLLFHLDNPNEIPVPTTEILVGLHVFPAQTFGELGAVCTTLCESGAADCPIPPDGACVERLSDIDTVEEFLVGAIQGGLILAAEAIGGQPVGQHLGLYTIPQGGRLDLKVTFAIGLDPMIKLLGYTAEEYVLSVVETGEAGFDIPYAVAGRLWFNVPYLGRISVGFGPYGDAEQPLYWPVL